MQGEKEASAAELKINMSNDSEIQKREREFSKCMCTLNFYSVVLWIGDSTDYKNVKKRKNKQVKLVK